MKRATLMLLTLALLGGVQQLRADYIPFSGSGTSGTIATPPGTEPWTVQHFGTPGDSWGIPGVGEGVVPWTGSASESVITVTFTNLPIGITIAPAGDTVMFNTATSPNVWTASYSPDLLTATYTAPAGLPLLPGDSFFLNISFMGAVAPGGVAFTGAFDPQDATTPEPATITLVASGFLAVGGFGLVRRRRRDSSESSQVC